MPEMTQYERGVELRRLHHDPSLLVLVNVWDVASTRVVASLPGCRAVATASHSIAVAHGYEDGEQIPLDLMLGTVGRISSAVDLPVTADLEAGYGNVDTTIRRAIEVGVVGADIEDEMRPFGEAVAAVAVAVKAAEAEGIPFSLNARTDAVLLAGDRDRSAVLADAVARGRAFLEAGATCVFVPGRLDAETVVALADVGADLLSGASLPEGVRPVV
jgi:2-methylisocitrate lyase-like PEP mutase family enzyme